MRKGKKISLNILAARVLIHTAVTLYPYYFIFMYKINSNLYKFLLPLDP